MKPERVWSSQSLLKKQNVKKNHHRLLEGLLEHPALKF